METRGVVGSVIFIIQLLFQLSIFLFKNKIHVSSIFHSMPVTQSVTGMEWIVNSHLSIIVMKMVCSFMTVIINYSILYLK